MVCWWFLSGTQFNSGRATLGIAGFLEPGPVIPGKGGGAGTPVRHKKAHESTTSGTTPPGTSHTPPGTTHPWYHTPLVPHPWYHTPWYHTPWYHTPWHHTLGTHQMGGVVVVGQMFHPGPPTLGLLLAARGEGLVCHWEESRRQCQGPGGQRPRPAHCSEAGSVGRLAAVPVAHPALPCASASSCSLPGMMGVGCGV